jgi:hypothetical protein
MICISCCSQEALERGREGVVDPNIAELGERSEGFRIAFFLPG